MQLHRLIWERGNNCLAERLSIVLLEAFFEPEGGSGLGNAFMNFPPRQEKNAWNSSTRQCG
jgi:hypothetical protein